MLRKILFIPIVILLMQTLSAQHTQVFTHDDKQFHEGKELYNQRKWAASYRSFEAYLNEAHPSQAGMIQEANYYRAANAYEMRQDNAERLINEYLSQHPYTPYESRVYMMLGMINYEKKEYLKAVNYFKLVDYTHLINREKYDFLFSLAYSSIELNEIEKALSILNILKNQDSSHQSAVRYYTGYCNYRLGNYDTALEDLLVIENNPDFSKTASYYITQIYYAKKEFAEMERRAELLLKNYPDNINNAELYRMIGEKAYSEENYLKAIENLTKYEQIFPQVLRNDIYYLGVSYLKTGLADEAIKYLSQATSSEDEMSESAYLLLGNAYVTLGDKNNARMAYEASLKTNFNKEVREEAMYNYALTTYETTTSFGESVRAFEQFIQEFPNSKQLNSAYDYLATVYLTSNNYQEAYRSINQIKNPTTKLKETKQYLEFKIGTEEFATSNYNTAIEFFTRSIQTLPSGKYTIDNYFWRGESHYRLKDYDRAVNNFLSFMNSPNVVNNINYNQGLYSLGYSYFSQKKYNDALPWFLKYINNEKYKNTSNYADALNRIGDIYFNNRNFNNAEQYYQKAMSMQYNADYALFQSAYISGLNKNYNYKIDKLEKLLIDYPQSEYGDDALYEIGRSFIMTNNNTKSIEAYKRLIDTYPNSFLAPKAQLEMGMVYAEQRLINNAIQMYKKVISDYPASEEASVALESLESIYIDLNNVDEYLHYTQSLGKSIQNQSKQRADSIQFIAAEKQYMNKNMSEAIKSLEKYMVSYCPGGKYCVLAQYYLADSYYISKDLNRALTEYDKMLNMRGNPYAEDAAIRAAEITFDNKEFDKSLEYFKQLETIAQNEGNKNLAKLGVLRTSYLLDDKNESVRIASEIISSSKFDNATKAEAYLNRSKVYVSQNLLSAALKDLKLIEIDTRTTIGAEANYLLADVNFKMNNLSDAEKVVLDFANKGTPHQYWLARSFIVLADVYLKKGDDFQAKQYLMSLQKNYVANDDVQGMISNRLNEINQRSNERVVK